jgi:5-formaminoimidazole-4-carboxamide-1-(beta)-D-ribofuranosyl 5'-monophosphate synthetase
MKLPTIGMIGSHSAEEIGIAAKSNGFRTVIVCQKGREHLYTHYNKHLYDDIIVLDNFRDVIRNDIQE